MAAVKIIFGQGLLLASHRVYYVGSCLAHSSLSCFKWWRRKKDELAPLREGDNTVKYIFRFSSVDMVNLASEVSWTVGKEDACLLLVKSISKELKHEQN